ncbi:hypothetical protein G9P44_004479 [Scheffersomyces stipitis]|nr:hypothetical protein G9P44_004479 [Scheffersomyces stipitis]
MFDIPESVKKLFDTFPLTTYPAIPKTTSGNDEFIEEKKFYFENEKQSQISTNASFSLGVHNVVEFKGQDGKRKYIPSDPVSLGQALILCHKNKLKLPTTSSTNRSCNSIMKVSFHASPDKQLPILIEDDKQSRTIRTISSIIETVAKSNFQKHPYLDAELLVLNDFIDLKLFDLWILCLLNESIDRFDEIFDIDSKLDLSFVAKSLVINNIYSEVEHWRAFRTRNPNLFDYMGQNTQMIASNTSLKNYYYLQIDEFADILPLWIKDINTDVSQNSIQQNIIFFKLSSYIVIIHELLQGTKLNEVLVQHPDFVKACLQVLQDF